jgi:hypothetical protein
VLRFVLQTLVVLMWGTWVGCSRTPLLSTAASDPEQTGSSGSNGRSGPTEDPTLPAPTENVCGRFEQVEVRNLDLLFVVDDSGSMKEEQTSLRRELPRMIERLVSGDTDGDGSQDMLPIDELHLGVVSSDMGLVGVTGIEKCEGLGDDGILQDGSGQLEAGCDASGPRFLTYRSADDDPAQVARDFGCIAALGTDGCGFEQQLEAGLKALWPSRDDSITFLPAPSGEGTRGHGDDENAGFLRPNQRQDTSLIAVVLVTDEDDCSSRNTSHLRPPQYLDPSNEGDALLMRQGLNVRCQLNPDNLYDSSRYVDGLRALRPNSEGLIVFAVIAGVPAELVTPETLTAVDFADTDEREAFYTALLADPAMQPRIDTLGTPDEQDDRAAASCDTVNGLAYPPVRLVETARAFGRDAVVQSICQDDFGPAIDAILAAITRASTQACVAR